MEASRETYGTFFLKIHNDVTRILRHIHSIFVADPFWPPVLPVGLCSTLSAEQAQRYLRPETLVSSRLVLIYRVVTLNFHKKGVMAFYEQSG